MKRKQPSRKDLLASCDSVGPEDGLDPKRYFRAAPSKVANRKALQLCGEVAKTLSFALGWEMGDDLLSRLCVVSVVPCPDSSRMLVTLTPNGELDGETGDVILDRLRQVVGKLRTIIARSIHRRRVPDLTFRVVTERTSCGERDSPPGH